MKSMFRPALVVFCVAGFVAPALGGPIIIDHQHTDITALSSGQLARAKAVLHIAYGHTSHGSQLTDGMTGLIGFANGGGLGLAYPNNFFAWNNGGTGGALDLHDYAMGGDVGYYPQWVNNTIAYLDNPANADVNVIIWSWCGQMDDKFRSGTLSNEYLLPMASLETSYPDVVFVYMTGHTPSSPGETETVDTTTRQACQAIRDFCAANNRVLYDFNDIEHYNPDGIYFDFVDDYCDLLDGPGGSITGNWAQAWQDSHTENVDWYTCSSAHSQPLNANRKAYAAWALWCAIAADLDRDDIPDEWEETHGNAAMFGGGTNDCDNDGVTDLHEYIADTDPDDTGSVFRIAALFPTNSFGITFQSSTGRVYSLSGCDALESGSWTAVEGQTNIPGHGSGVTTLTDTNDALTRAFRVGVGLR